MNVAIKGKQTYSRFTLFSWMLFIREILETEIGEKIHVELVDGENDEPELYINDVLICSGVPSEEGYLIELVKSAALRLKTKIAFTRL